jgi:hypothetical protein
LLDLGIFFSSVIFFTQAVGLLGRVITHKQGRYLHTGQHKHNKRTHRHPCLWWVWVTIRFAISVILFIAIRATL